MDNNPVKKDRRFLHGAAVVLASLAGAVGSANASAAVTPELSGSGAIQSEFVIAPAQTVGAMQFSHESHSSHDSHSSHSSHTSHVSSSG